MSIRYKAQYTIRVALSFLKNHIWDIVIGACITTIFAVITEWGAKVAEFETLHNILFRLNSLWIALGVWSIPLTIAKVFWMWIH